LGTGKSTPVAEFSATLEKRYAGYYFVGRLFVKAISNPLIMSTGVWLAMRSPATMTPMVAIMANLMPGVTPDRIEQVYSMTQRLRERAAG
jgi:hypothetical protein